MVIEAPFGSWSSPISAKLVTKSTIDFREAKSFGNTFYFIEMRPEEKGRYVLCKINESNKIEDVEFSVNANVRSRVHEYGGDAFLIFQQEGSQDHHVIFTDFSTQSLYLDNECIVDGKISKKRFTNGFYDKIHNSFIFICEDHSVLEGENPEKEAKNCLVEIYFDKNASSWKIQIISEGHNFYSSPNVSSDGEKIAFVAWNHPNMPWDNTLLYEFDRKSGKTRLVAGNDESIMHPVYSPDNTLYFISDRNGSQSQYWNLFRENKESHDIESVVEINSDLAYPAWNFSIPSFLFLDENHIISSYSEDKSNIFIYDIEKKNMELHKTQYSHIYALSLLDDKKNLFFFGQHSQIPTEIVRYNLQTREFQVIKQSSKTEIDKSFFSVPQKVEITGRDYISHGFYYPPTNPNYIGSKDEKPIVLIKAHGGPTGAASTAFNIQYQYWTSRGIAIMDVDYIGSTGYGREFRRKLYGNWGIYDVEDCCGAIKSLASKGLADENRILIDGRSAGGFTTLACLAFTDKFAAGASLYGIADLELLLHDTHKFESRYLDQLIGEYPKDKHKYYERSPIHYADKITAPLLLLQGDEDKIVPPNQAIEMFKILQEKGQPVALRMFKGEQHGFRSSEAIIESLESELYFFGKVLKFAPADLDYELEIANM